MEEDKGPITRSSFGNTNPSTSDIKKNVSQVYHDYYAKKILTHKNQLLRNKKIKIYKLLTKNDPYNIRRDFCLICRQLSSKIKESCSSPNLNDIKNKYSIRSKTKSTNEISSPFNCHFTVNRMKSTEHFYNSRNLRFKRSWKIYRCQFNTQEESCCCSCNSDAMFEVMKSLYDCYKKKNCDHCNCILCGHLPREERRLGEQRKSEISIKEVSVAEKIKEKIKAKSKKISKKFKAEELILKKGIPSAKLRKAKAEGLLTPLEGKTPEQKEKILRGLAMYGIPLPPSKTTSEKNLIDKVRKDLGLPPEPLTPTEKKKYNKAMESGLITPLEGKSASDKEKILRGLANLGVPLPEGRTPSEHSLIKNIREKGRALSIEKAKAEAILSKKRIPSAKLRKAKAEGLLTPLEGKTPEQKEKILRGLAMNGIPLPPSRTASEKKLIDKIRKDLGLPPEPLTPAEKKKYNKAMESGLITPLEGKSGSDKEKILRGLANLGVPLPEGRTPSEQSLIKNIREKARAPSIEKAKAEAIVSKKSIPSEKLRKAKEEGLLTPLEGKTLEQKEKILRGLALNGIPLPPSKTASEKKLIDKVRKDLGLPPEPVTPAEKTKYNKAMESGLITPLEGKSASDKEKILRGLADLGAPLPEGRTPSEQSLIKNIREKARAPSIEKVKAEAIVSKKRIPSAKLRKAKAEGLLTPLEGKTPEQKEIILRGLAMNGIPLPSSKTVSEKNLIDKVRKDLGLPPEPLTPSEKKKYNKAMESGLITPLEGKSASDKEKILRGLADLGVPLPEGRTPSEKSLIKNIREKARAPSIEKVKAEAIVTKRRIPSAKLRKAKAEGLLTPLEGKTPEQKEKILRGLAMNGIPLPPSKTASEKKLIDKVRRDLGLPPEPITPSEKNKYDKAMESGLITPLAEKSASEKERILQGLHDTGIPLPEGRTPSEKDLIQKIKTGKVKRPKYREKGIGTPALPLEERKKLDEKTLKVMKEGKGPSDECICGLLTPESERISKISKFFHPTKITPSQKEKMLMKQAEMGVPLPEGRTPSEKALIEKVRASVKPGEITPRTKVSLPSPIEGKTAEEREKILRNLAKAGLPLPEGKTPSEKQVIKKVKQEMGIVSEASEKLRKAKAAGLLTPLEGKTPAQKEEILKRYIEAGLPLPDAKTPSEKKIMKNLISKSSKLLRGKTPSQKEKILRSIAKQGLPLPEPKTASEKAITEKVQRELGISREILTPSKKLKRAKADGLLTPLTGKKPEEKERILRDLARAGIPLPEAKTSSEQKVIDKVRQNLGLPPEPKTPSLKEKMKQAHAAGIITPLNGKTSSEKEKVLRKMLEARIPLPKGRTKSEKSLIKKIETEEVSPVPSKGKKRSEKLKEAKAKGIMTPLEGKSIAHKEKILRGLAKSGLPLPEGKTPSEKALIAKIQAEEGLIPSRPTPLPEKYIKLDKKTAKVMKEGKGPSDECICDLLTPESEKEKIRLPLLKKPSRKIPSEKIPKLEGKPTKEKEKILKDLAMQKLPLPEPKTASERKLIDKVRAELGLPPHPKTPSAKENYNKAMAAGLITPLQGKSASQKEKILRGQAELGLPLPVGRTPSEKALIAKIKAAAPKPAVERIPSEKMQKLKAAGLLTPLTGKTPEQKEKILKGLAMHGVPLPEPKTASERKLTDKVRAELGLPPHPKTPSAKENYNKAMAAGLITPLQGKSASQKEKILRGQAELGLPLPEGRTPSEKALIAKIKAAAPKPAVERIPSEKMQKLKAAGLLTPLTGKTPEQKEKILKGLAMHGVPLPEPKTASERKLTDKVRAELGLPPHPKTPSAKVNYNKAMAAGLITPLQGKSASQKEKILRGQAELGLPLPEGGTPSEKALIAKIKAAAPKPAVERIPSEKMQKLKAAGLLTPLTGKTPEQKEKILKGLAMHGVPLPEPKTASERKLTDKVRAELGLPPHPKTPSAKVNYNKAMAAGLITPLQGKSASQKEKILRGQAELGLPLPEGGTPSEKALIAKIKAAAPKPAVERIPSEKMQKLKAAGLLTPLTGKTPEQKEKILKGLAMHGVPLPEPKTASERKLTDKVRAELGLPPHPKTPSAKENYNKAMGAGLITPLEGKSVSQKEKILKGLAELGIPLPEGRTPSEKALIEKIKATAPKPVVERIPSEKLQKLKAAGLLTPLTGKTPEQKEKILKGLAMNGVPLPEPKTASERKLNDKVRAELGLPPHPKTPSAKENYNKAMAAGFITPLQGKSASQKEKILKGQAELGIPLPEGRTPSEKALIEKIKATAPKRVVEGIPSEKLQKLKAAGLLTPLTGKTPEQKEKILKGLAMNGVPLPEPKTASERKLNDKVRAELGLPPHPKTPSAKENYNKAMAAGFITPLQGKSVSQKEKILKGQAELGIPLPEGRTPSEKALIEKIKATAPKPVVEGIPSEKLQKLKAAGLLTPLTGKTPEQKEKILKGLAMNGVPLPEPKTASERKLIDKVHAELGLPPQPKTSSEKLKYKKALAAGLITPLHGKSAPQKEKILRGQAEMGLGLPEGRTPSEKALIQKIKETGPPKIKREPSEKLRKLKGYEILETLKGKTPKQKEEILKDLAQKGISLPEGRTASEKKIINKVRAEVGLPAVSKTPSKKEKYMKALPLPEKLADLDKKTAKIMKEGKGPSDECICKLLTPEFEKIAPIPKRKPPSKVIPELYKVPSKKLRKAKAAGLLTPLQGKSTEEKEKILRGLAMNGIPLPEGKTASEKKLIDKIRNAIGLPPEPKSPMKEKYNQAIADDIIIPLEGKTNAEKEKILKRQAELGLPLPIGRTPSEKAIIAKIIAVAPKPAAELIPSEKRIRKAQAAGLLTPLEGKSPEKKEKILKGLFEAGMPLPEGKTPSEKALIHKILTQAGVSPEIMAAAKKSKIKTKSKKIEAVEARRSARRVGVSKSKGGIVEEFQDIIKTTTCDRGCGCDKKKIRFKHSYVKIRVTSPDISSLCPCPEECVPGVKGGIFTDNEGIKVTVGRVTGVASFSSRKSIQYKSNYKIYKTVSNHIYENSQILKNIISIGTNINNNYSNVTHSTKSETEIYSHMGNTKRHNFQGSRFNCFSYDCTSNNSSIEDTDLIQSSENNDSSHSLDNVYILASSKRNSTASIYLLKTISSVSLVTLPDTVSVWSIYATSTSAACTSIPNKSNTLEDVFIQSAFGSFSDISLDVYDYSSATSSEYNQIPISAENNLNPEVQIYIANESKSINTEKSKEEETIGIVESFNSADRILQLLYRQLSQNEMYNTPSFIVIMSSSSDNRSSILPVDDCSSTICLQLTENQSIWNTRSSGLHHVQQKQIGFKIAAHKNSNDQKKNTVTCKSRIISMDTTVDRPCCCLTEAIQSQNVFDKPEEGKVDSILSEFVTPLMHKVVARGLSPESYNVWNYPKETTRPSYISSSHSQLCRRPPSIGSRGCHYNSKPKYNADIGSNNVVQQNINKPCRCNPSKFREMLEQSSNQLTSKSCGVSTEALCEKRVRLNQRTVQVPYELSNRTTKMTCDGCDLSEFNLRSDLSNDKKTMRSCPCGQSKKDLGVSTKNHTEESIQFKDPKHLKKYKNVVCECPEEPEPELIEYEIDEKQMRKIKSDLTLTLSGFKIDVLKKTSDSEMSFEEALRYFAENLEEDQNMKKNTSTGCECPLEPFPPQVEPFMGIKFHIDGKGTATKGLSGILCFE